MRANPYMLKTFDELLELMKERRKLNTPDAKDLQDAYRIKFQEFLDDSRTRHASILAVLGANYARCLSN